jgi:hypothetical protein
MDALDRMFHSLVRALRAKQPALLTSPFTVSDLHQQILPYRHFRRELGLETNQEYELVLMELLTGARGYLDVDEQLRDQLGKELTSSSPEPSRVRDFADAHAAINPAALAAIPDGRPVREDISGATRPAIGASMAGLGAVSGGPRCRFCNGELPQGRPLHFCPHCGQNLQVKNCPACGAEVEADWKFCVACGKTVS